MRLKEALEGILQCAVFVVDCTDVTESSFQTPSAKCIFNYRDGRTREAGFLPHLMVRTAECLLNVVFFLPDVQSYTSCAIFQLCSQHKIINFVLAFFYNIHQSSMWALH